MATWTDNPDLDIEYVINGSSQQVAKFRYRGNSTDGFECVLYVPPRRWRGNYSTKAAARSAGDAILGF